MTWDDLEDRWIQIKSTGNERTLLRRAILRELSHRLHTGRSKAMATGSAGKMSLAQITGWEVKVQRQIQSDLNEPTLHEQLESHSEKRENPELPKSILSIVPADRWNRFDRKWERALMHDAVLARWHLTRIDVEIAPSEAETFHHSLAANYWPRAIVLFVDPRAEAPSTGLWAGSWYLLTQSNAPLNPQSLSDQSVIRSETVLFP